MARGIFSFSMRTLSFRKWTLSGSMWEPVSRPGIKPRPLALGVLATGPPGKSQAEALNANLDFCHYHKMLRRPGNVRRIRGVWAEAPSHPTDLWVWSYTITVLCHWSMGWFLGSNSWLIHSLYVRKLRFRESCLKTRKARGNAHSKGSFLFKESNESFYEFPRAAMTSYHNYVAYNPGKVFSHSSGAWSAPPRGQLYHAPWEARKDSSWPFSSFWWFPAILGVPWFVQIHLLFKSSLYATSLLWKIHISTCFH